MPAGWNQSKVTAVAATALLHVLLAIWLLQPRPQAPVSVVAPSLTWLMPPPPLELPPPPEPMPITIEPPGAMPSILEMPEDEAPVVLFHDWQADARSVARELRLAPEPHRFGRAPEEPKQLKSKRPPPSVFERPLPRVGTTVRTPDGELITWVSDNCYISLSSQSLTLADLHKGRRGIRTCSIPIGRKEPRGDLFDPIKRPRPEP